MCVHGLPPHRILCLGIYIEFLMNMNTTMNLWWKSRGGTHVAKTCLYISSFGNKTLQSHWFFLKQTINKRVFGWGSVCEIHLRWLSHWMVFQMTFHLWWSCCWDSFGLWFTGPTSSLLSLNDAIWVRLWCHISRHYDWVYYIGCVHKYNMCKASRIWKTVESFCVRGCVDSKPPTKTTSSCIEIIKESLQFQTHI